MSGDSEAGPIVATIFVLCEGSIIGVPIIHQSLGKGYLKEGARKRTA